MRIKILALILTCTMVSWAQTANPNATPTSGDKPAASSAPCPCCDSMSKDNKDMPIANDQISRDGKDTPMSCDKMMSKDGKAMACCHHDAKDGKSEMACCSGKEGKEACMQDGKNAGSCCGTGAACCKDHAKCCAGKDNTQTAKGCCSGKCDRRAHEHASGM